MNCIEYLEKEIRKTERSIKWAEKKSNVKYEEMFGLNRKLKILNEIKTIVEQHFEDKHKPLLEDMFCPNCGVVYTVKGEVDKSQMQECPICGFKYKVK